MIHIVDGLTITFNRGAVVEEAPTLFYDRVYGLTQSSCDGGLPGLKGVSVGRECGNPNTVKELHLGCILGSEDQEVISWK